MKIKRKFLGLLICFSLALGLVPAMPAEAADDPIYSAISEQYEAYVRAIGSADASDGANVLYRHAIRGNGKYLSLGSDSAFTKGMLRANVARMAFTEAISAAAEYMLVNNYRTLGMAGTNANYSYDTSFDIHIYESTDEAYISDRNNALILNFVRGKNPIPGFKANEYDQMLRDVVGASLLRVFLERISVNKDNLHLKVTLKMMDDFDFNGSQNSSASLGGWLDGKFIDSYSWESTVSFELTVPNTCSHYEESGVYRWEVNDGQMVNVSGEGLDPNWLDAIEIRNADGNVKGYYYKTDKTIHLYNDRPWSVEYRIGRNNQFVIGRTATSNYGAHFFWTTNYFCCMDAWDEDFVKADGSTGRRRVCGQLRYNYESRLWNTQHTYRIENRIAADGSNMAWLLIDGEEIGPLDDYWLRYTGADNKLHNDFIRDGDPWFDTADFDLNYFFTTGSPMTDGCKLEYVQIWENGEEEPYKYYTDYTTGATCTEGAKAVHVCHACGAEYSKELSPALGHSFGEYIPDNKASCTEPGTETAVCTVCGEKDTVLIEGSALGHKEETIPGYAPSCLADGLTDGKRCAVCGETTLAQTAIPALGHSWDGGTVTKAPTTTEAGELTYTCEVCGETKTEEISGIPAPEFEDVPVGSWYYEPAAWAAYKGITSGVTETQFAPAQGCTRAQAVTFLWRAAGEPEPERTDCPFEDVGENAYYRDAVLWAAEQGITSGTGEGEFSPNAVCTRAQIAAFIWRWMGEPESGGKLPFEDAPSEAWYAPAVAWAVETGVTSGVSADSFAPNSTCTRAQIVTFLYRACS